MNAAIQSDVWWAGLVAGRSIGLALGVGGLLLLLVLGLGALARLGAARRRPVLSILGQDSGTASVEFALLMPILLFIVLVMAQSMMLLAGNIFVHYASFAAARSAIVQIPAVYPDADANVYEGQKVTAVFRAAALALVPVAGRGGSGDAHLASEMVNGLQAFFSGYGNPPPPWVQGMLRDKVLYATDPGNTEITVFRTLGGRDSDVDYQETTRFEPRDAVTVRVDHRLALTVPWARHLFADNSRIGARPSEGTPGATWVIFRARATLTNDGILDRLPPRPDLPRRDPQLMGP